MLTLDYYGSSCHANNALISSGRAEVGISIRHAVKMVHSWLQAHWLVLLADKAGRAGDFEELLFQAIHKRDKICPTLTR